MASKKMDRLKSASSTMDKYFSEGSQTATETASDDKGTDTKGTAKKRSEEPKKTGKKVFSFRAEESIVDSWRVWADAKGIKVDELGEKAIQEYIKRHPLSDDQNQIYELKMAQKKS